ncbi:DUF4388 domain-containing protein [Gemmatimonas sp.]|jgi:hypothetical protein|uniref:DUF4388 domain-containing protein n=1 Tax=Gemmatimonas sp. TaxID=1962908 RepID=UPI0037C1873E
MSLEGRLRDLGLAEVLQLLAVSRKSGVLHLEAALQGRDAAVHFQNGLVVNAGTWHANGTSETLRPRRADEAREVEAVVLDLLLWRDGTFRFAPADQHAPTGASIRLAVEPLLMEAAQRAEGWARIEDLIPHSRVIPAFVDLEPQQLPLLRLAPAQWEILTRIDGQRDLMMLADSLGRDLLEVAEQVHGLIGAGLLALYDGPVAPRRNPTPPAMAAIPAPAGHEIAGDLWIPPATHTRHSSAPPDERSLANDEDSLFDPVELGVISPHGVPRPRASGMPRGAVALEDAEPSLPRGGTAGRAPRAEAITLCRLGDEAARRGDFANAMTHWDAALRLPEPFVDAERVREAMALTARLHALLHP